MASSGKPVKCSARGSADGAVAGMRQEVYAAQSTCALARTCDVPPSCGSSQPQGYHRRKMATYVLVHGAWGGSYNWRKLRPMLQAAGHTVFNPSLTGLGERAHLASPSVNLSTHIQDVCNALFYEDLTDVILVGHSYGGMVVTGVADRMPERIKHLVFLDAFVPGDGQSLRDLAANPNNATPDTGDWRVPARQTNEPMDEWSVARR